MKKFLQIYDSQFLRKIEIIYGVFFNAMGMVGSIGLPILAYTQREFIYLAGGILVVWLGLLYKNYRMIGFVRRNLKKLIKKEEILLK